MPLVKVLLAGALKCFAILALITGNAYARLSVPIIDHLDVPVLTGSGQAPTSAQVRAAITAAALANRWDVDSAQSGRSLSATLNVRGKHTVTVSLPYAPEKFSIKYLSSVNMNYELGKAPSEKVNSGSDNLEGVPLIHPNYNRWIQELRQGILRELKKL